jgi:hypothetical protein
MTQETRPVKAILCTRFGTAEDLVLADIADPAAGPGEVVTAVKAVGLNFYDTLIVSGRYQKQRPSRSRPAASSRASWKASAPASRASRPATA